MQRALDIRGAAGLGLHTIDFLRFEKDIAGAVDQNADAELVDRRHRAIGPALAISMQANPPAAAAAANPADIFMASRRLKLSMGLFWVRPGHSRAWRFIRNTGLIDRRVN